jgi:hypothetical protein
MSQYSPFHINRTTGTNVKTIRPFYDSVRTKQDLKSCAERKMGQQWFLLLLLPLSLPPQPPPMSITNTKSNTKENEVGRACGTYGRGDKSVQVSGGKAQRKQTTNKTEA